MQTCMYTYVSMHKRMYMRGTVRMAFYTEGLGDSKAEDDPRFGYIKGLGFRV